MKRIFTLAIIAMIATLSFAQAPAVKAAAKKQIQKVMTTQQMQKGQAMKAAADAKAKAAQEISGSVLRNTVKAPKGITVAQKAVMEKAQSSRPKTAVAKTAETVDLDVVLNNAQYYGAPDYDWFYVFNSKDGLYQFRFDIANQPEDALPLDQEFTLADMVVDYSWGVNQLTGDYIEYASVSFKATQGANGIDYHATVVDLYGNTYNLKLETIAYPEITGYKTVNFTEDQVEFVDQTRDGGVFQIIGDSGNGIMAYIAFVSNKVVGTYTIDDVYIAATRIFLSDDDYIGVEPFYVDADVRKDGATIIYRGFDGIEYTLNFAYTLEEPTINNLTAELPYVNGFDTEAEQAEAAIYDANGDGKTFTFAEDSNTGSMTARYTYSSANTGDDYVVFPGLALEAGKSYKVAVDARSYSAGWPERLEVVAGTEAKASKLNISVIEPTDIASGEYITLNAEFKPEADGVYYFAIHGISDADQFYLYTDNFYVKEVNPNEPMAPTFTVESDENASLSALVTINVPSQTVSGAPITKGVTLNVSRNGQPIWRNDVKAGATVPFLDVTVPEPGYCTYAVTATVDGIASEVASSKVYVGEDVPEDVTNLEITDLSGKVGMTWDAPTEGINGGIIIPENVRYNVYPVEMIEFFGMLFPEIDFSNPYATGLTETQAEVDFDTNAGAQQYTYFGVTSSNVAGESMGMMGAVLTGAPYELPVHEGLTGQALHYWWGTSCDDANYALEGGLYVGEDSSDGDDVCFLFDAETAGWISMESGKIALNGAENAGLAFDFKADAPCTLNVKVVTPEGEEIVGLMPVDNTEWATATIMLDAYADQPWVRVRLIGEFDDASVLYVDNVNVLDMVAHDLSVAVSAPKSLTAGKSAVVKATVINMGQETAQDYTVKFYVNDTELPTPMFEIPALAFFESAEFEAELATSVFDEAGDVTVKAEVVYALDVKSENNADETLVALVAPSVTPVQSVAAEATANGIVVNWTVAETSASEVTEDFESYDANTVYADGESCGPWLAADKSQGTTYSWNSGAWGHMGEAYSFGIIDVEAEGLAETFPAASGSKMAIFMSEVNESTQQGQQSDKYMISPELPGMAQTISFSAQIITGQYGAEEFEIMASSTDNDPASFTSVQKFSVANEGMEEYAANLPEGTKYFAIHYTSTDIFGLFVDDVKYTTGGSNPTGFNVYVDQVLEATVEGDKTSYTITEATAGEHEVSVTALYANAESAPVTVVVEAQAGAGATGIQSVSVSDAKAEIYTVNGVRVQNANKPGVYVINGRKAVIK